MVEGKELMRHEGQWRKVLGLLVPGRHSEEKACAFLAVARRLQELVLVL